MNRQNSRFPSVMTFLVDGPSNPRLGATFWGPMRTLWFARPKSQMILNFGLSIWLCGLKSIYILSVAKDSHICLMFRKEYLS